MKWLGRLLAFLLLAGTAQAQTDSFLATNGTFKSPFALANTWTAAQTFNAPVSFNAGLTQALTQFHFFIGNGSGISADTALSGDCVYGAGGIVCSTLGGLSPFNAANISSGTLNAARLPAFGSADVSCASAGGACTIAANAVTNAKLATAAQNTVKGAATSTAEADLAVPSCSTATSALTWTTNTGFGCNSIAAGITTRSYLAGNTLSGGGSTTLTITAGQATSDDQTTSMALGSTYTKTFAAWAVGSGNGGLDTGAIAANTWYHVFIIERTDTQVVDVLISLSATAPTLPTNYTKQRRIGSIRTDATPNILAFSQNGDEFLWAANVGDVNTTLSSVSTLFTLTVPTGVKVNATYRANVTGTGGVVGEALISSPDENTLVWSTPTGNASLLSETAVSIAGAFNTRTNTSAQIRAVAGTATNTFQIVTYGWIDTRGRFN